MSDTPHVTIRKATRQDAGLILNFIRKKAAFDGALHSVEATEEKLTGELFGPQPPAFVLFAEIDGHSVGIAIYFLTFSSFLSRPGIWLDDLYVEESARGRGAGRALLAHLAKLADERGYGRVEWITAVGNAKGLAFYQRNGARVRESSRLLRLDRPAINRLAQEGTV